MAHQMLQRGHGDAGTNHVGAKRVPQAMGVDLVNLTVVAMMAEQRAETGGSQRPAALAAFEGNEQSRGVGERSFETEIWIEDLDEFRRQWQNALLVCFAEDAQLGVGQLEILQLESEDFAGAQAIEQHQTDHGKIAKGAKAAPERGDFVSREGHNNALGLPQTEAPGQCTPRPTITKREACGIGALEVGLAGRNLAAIVEAI